MKAETAGFVAKATRLRERAAALLDAGFVEDAGRAAYLAGFHAAQALIFERRGRSPKTHGGVQAEFANLVRDDPRVDAGVRGFLGRAYNLKTLADYDLNAADASARARVEAAVGGAGRVVAAVEVMLRADDG